VSFTTIILCVASQRVLVIVVSCVMARSRNFSVHTRTYIICLFVYLFIYLFIYHTRLIKQTLVIPTTCHSSGNIPTATMLMRTVYCYCFLVYLITLSQLNRLNSIEIYEW
jgi:hypothetical protein